MHKLSTLVAIVGTLALSGCLAANGTENASDGSIVAATEAGSFFGEVCIDRYPDLENAQAAAQSVAGLAFNAASGLFEHPTKELQMRINADRCAIRYLTDTPKTEILTSFSNASTPPTNAARVERANGLDIRIGTEDGGGGLTRASAIR